MLANGGPFSHLILGHSMLHGLGAITAIMGLCLVQREREAALTWRGLILLALPALAVAVNSVAALYCVGVVGILLFWGRLRSAAFVAADYADVSACFSELGRLWVMAMPRTPR